MIADRVCTELAVEMFDQPTPLTCSKIEYARLTVNWMLAALLCTEATEAADAVKVKESVVATEVTVNS